MTEVTEKFEVTEKSAAVDNLYATTTVENIFKEVETKT